MERYLRKSIVVNLVLIKYKRWKILKLLWEIKLNLLSKVFKIKRKIKINMFIRP